jgi:ubiquinone/menaquinone biosynthesis C-methylase UbiE
MTYTPGHSERSLAFMAGRRVEEHFAFVLGYLAPGMDLLDCGCGPGTLTAQLAARVAPGRAVGVDASAEQFALGRAAAAEAGVDSLELVQGVIPPLPFADGSFDAVTAHALVEHLDDPSALIAEIRRVLRPGGVAGICTIDWGGFLISPEDEPVRRALEDYEALMISGGGTPRLGRALPELVEEAGLALVEVGARYECHADLHRIADYLGATLGRAGRAESAAALSEWAERGRLFAQAWVWTVARSPS